MYDTCCNRNSSVVRLPVSPEIPHVAEGEFPVVAPDSHFHQVAVMQAELMAAPENAAIIARFVFEASE
jgi:hypothetical protein